MKTKFRHLYVLDTKGRPVLEDDVLKWAAWFETANTSRFVGETHIKNSRVSTVFLGIDNNFFSHGPPILWETMVFGGKLDQEQTRCSGSREQAEAMHAQMVKKVQA